MGEESNNNCKLCEFVGLYRLFCVYMKTIDAHRNTFDHQCQGQIVLKLK